MRKVLIGLVAVLAVTASASAANMLENGGFETGDLTGWVNVPGDGGGTAQVFSGGSWGIPATEGSYFAGWVSSWDTTRNNAYLNQQFTKPADTMLDWSIDLYADTTAGEWSVGVDVFYDPNGGTDPDADTATWIAGEWNQYNPGSAAWGSYSGQMNSGAGTTGTIFIKTVHNWGVEWNKSAVDNVLITPEPAAALLLLAGLPLLRRRRA
ncbi:MAG: hypothetical protein GX616_23175 [Planctomycetes bacterium]|nr:hypothetical protein [Planctomycetota bacterium]